MRRAGPTWRSSPKSAVPCETAPLAFPPPKISLLLITLRDSGSRIGTRYPPVGWSAAALLIRRRTPKRRTRSRCYGPSTDSVSAKLIKKSVLVQHRGREGRRNCPELPKLPPDHHWTFVEFAVGLWFIRAADNAALQLRGPATRSSQKHTRTPNGATRSTRLPPATVRLILVAEK